ncbi:MAG: PQQ-binding-like beta-propeller repeat protein [Deltaproteobacteria bacterium]|nr:PQQ-binding-like beta-propeller repeat protein [Deltaproteobacteria bacterium]
MQRRTFLRLGAAGLAAAPLRADAKDAKIAAGGTLPDVVHSTTTVTRDPYPWHTNGVAHLPAWDGATSSESVPGSMRMFRGNLTGTYYGSGTVSERPKVLWKFRMSDFATKLRGRPVRWQGTGWTGQALTYGDYVFVGSVGGHVHCFEANTGKLTWVFAGERMFKGSPCIYRNRLYIPCVDDHLRCLDASTGKLLWDWKGWADIDSSPRVVDKRLYIGGEDGDLKCFDPETGALVWKHAFGQGTGDYPGSDGIESSLAIADGVAYFGHLDGNVRAYSLADRRVLWWNHLGVDVDASPLIVGDRLYVGVEEGAPTFHCIDRHRGDGVWARDVPKGIWSSAAVSNGKHVIVGGNDGKLYCFDLATGKDVWTFEIGAPTWASPQVVDGKVMFGAFDESYRIVDAAKGKLIAKVDVGERCYSGAAIEDGKIWVGSASGNFYCIG